jgi:cell division protein FtsI/penicillin-binding protein 2
LPFPHALDAVRQGMRLAVQSGSARPCDLERRVVRAKTGTATWSGDARRRHGWLAGYLGTVAVVVFVADGTGYRDAARGAAGAGGPAMSLPPCPRHRRGAHPNPVPPEP